MQQVIIHVGATSTRGVFSGNALAGIGGTVGGALGGAVVAGVIHFVSPDLTRLRTEC